MKEIINLLLMIKIILLKMFKYDIKYVNYDIKDKYEFCFDIIFK